MYVLVVQFVNENGECFITYGPFESYLSALYYGQKVEQNEYSDYYDSYIQVVNKPT